jgi:opacity protein-like surface antigen
VRKFAIILGIALGLCGSTSAFGQDVPRIEIFGGYSYLNYDTSGVRNALLSIEIPTTVTSRTNTNGWEATPAYNFSKWGGVEADFSGHYKGNCEGVIGLTCSNLSFMGGPRLTYRRGRLTIFAHGLFGGDRVSLSASSSTIFGSSIAGFSASVYETKFALAAGGGADYALGKRLSIRIAQVDYVLTKHFGEFGISHQNNIRVSAGIVFTFGGTREASSGARNQTTSAPIQGEESVLLGIAGYVRRDGGVVVTAVHGLSPAAAAGIKPGDLIMTIDGQPVHSFREIETAVGTSNTGTVRVTYFESGVLQTEREVKVR